MLYSCKFIWKINNKKRVSDSPGQIYCMQCFSNTWKNIGNTIIVSNKIQTDWLVIIPVKHIHSLKHKR